jgi:hypothetical protein
MYPACGVLCGKTHPLASTRPAIDPLAEIFEPADEVAAGLAKLESGPPLWGERREWLELISRLRAFEQARSIRARGRRAGRCSRCTAYTSVHPMPGCRRWAPAFWWSVEATRLFKSTPRRLSP